MDEIRVFVQDIDLAQVDHAYRAPHVADVQRLVVAVEYQYLLLHTLTLTEQKSPSRHKVPDGLA
jgi:hypothetical protein